MAPRSFATEFLLRELLAALGASPEASAGADSLSESMSEDTESQAAAPLGSQPRVMLVRRTNSSRQTVTLVDRQYDVEAFIPSHVRDALRKDFDYQTIGRLSGSVVRVTKYHFATLERCLATDQAQQTSRSAPHMGQGKARVYLWVDALAIVQDSELAVNTLPDVYSHPLVVEKLQALTDAELEKQLMIHQGLPPIGTESDRFDDERPLLEEDCVIPEDQEQALEQQDEWGPPERQPTDSELIEENGNVSMTESQVMRVVVTSPEKGTQDSVLTAASSGNSSVTLSGNPSVSVSDEASFKSSPGSQKLQFQQENIRETFVVGSDVESEAEEEDDSEQKSEKATPRPPTSQRGRRSERRQSLAPSSPAPTPSQDSWMVVDLTADTPEKAPQAAAVDEKQAQKSDQEPKTEVAGSLEGHNDAAASPPRPEQSSETQAQHKENVITRLLKFFSPGAADGPQSSAGEESDSAEQDEPPATQVLDQPEEEKAEDTKEEEDGQSKRGPTAEFMSSQETMVLDFDNDENANAFEYEGMSSGDLASPRTVVLDHDNRSDDNASAPEADTADDLTLTEQWAEDAVTPEKKTASEGTGAELQAPSSSARTVTPGTDRRAEAEGATRHTPSIEDSADQARPASPPNVKGPVPPTAPSAQLSPSKSPSKLVIALSASNSTGFSPAESRGSKRRHQQAAPSPATEQEQNPSPSQTQEDNQTQKRRRRQSPSALEGGSQSPQFEQPAAPFLTRRTLESARGNVLVGSLSLDAVWQSLGARARDDEPNAEEDRPHASRQPRRAWKRYESLFPPLNMTRLKQRMAEGKD